MACPLGDDDGDGVSDAAVLLARKKPTPKATSDWTLEVCVERIEMK